MWGSASDNQRVYVANNNFGHLPLDLAALKAVPNQPGATSPPASANGGLAAALDAWSGDLIWCVAGARQGGLGAEREHWAVMLPQHLLQCNLVSCCRCCCVHAAPAHIPADCSHCSEL